MKVRGKQQNKSKEKKKVLRYEISLVED